MLFNRLTLILQYVDNPIHALEKIRPELNLNTPMFFSMSKKLRVTSLSGLFAAAVFIMYEIKSVCGFLFFVLHVTRILPVEAGYWLILKLHIRAKQILFVLKQIMS